MRVAIIGSRKIDNAQKILELILYNIPIGCSEIISGGAVGVDSLAADAARKLHIHLVELCPDYAVFGKAAPLVRNRAITDYADCVLALWDYQSKGTRSVILDCIRSGKPVKIVCLT